MPKRKAPKDKTGVKEEGLPEAPAAKKASTGGSQKSTRGSSPLPASPRPTRQGSPRLLPGPREVATRHPAEFPMTPELLSMTPSSFIPPYMREYLTYHQSYILESAKRSGLMEDLTIDKNGMIYATGLDYYYELRIAWAVKSPQVLSDVTKKRMEDLIVEKEDSIWWKHTVLAAKKMLAKKVVNFGDLAGAMERDLEACGWIASIIDMISQVLRYPEEKENGVVKNHLLCPMNKQHPGITIADARKAVGEAIQEQVKLKGATTKREELEEKLEIFCALLETGRWGLAASHFWILEHNLQDAMGHLDEVFDLVDKEFMTEKAKQMASTYGSWEGMAWIYGAGEYEGYSEEDD